MYAFQLLLRAFSPDQLHSPIEMLMSWPVKNSKQRINESVPWLLHFNCYTLLCWLLRSAALHCTVYSTSIHIHFILLLSSSSLPCVFFYSSSLRLLYVLDNDVLAKCLWIILRLKSAVWYVLTRTWPYQGVTDSHSTRVDVVQVGVQSGQVHHSRPTIVGWARGVVAFQGGKQWPWS